MAAYQGIAGGVVLVTNAGAPTDGTSGTGVNVAGPGSLLIDTTNCNLYQNTNTKASPTWTQFSDLSGALAFTDLDAGASGSAGSIDVFPATASKGKIAITATNNTDNYTVGLTNAAHGQASTYSIPDSGAAAAYIVVTTGANTAKIACGGSDRTITLGGDLTTGGAVSLAGTLTTGGNVTFSGAFAAQITVPSASTWVLPSGGGTLATTTGAETGTTESTFTVDSDSAAAKIALDTNSATGDFTLSLVPANLTADRTVSFADASGTVMVLDNGGSQTADGDFVITGTVDLQGNITASAGNPDFDWSGSSGAFSTGTGAVTIAGDLTHSGNVSFDYSGSSGTFKTSTGTNTLNGNVVIAGSKTLATGTGTVTVNGATTFSANINVGCAAGTTAVDFSAGTGTFKTTTGAHTLAGDVTISGSKTLTTGTGNVSIKGATIWDAGLDLSFAGAGDGTVDFSTQTGIFKTTTGAHTIGGDVTVAANKYLSFTAGTGYVQINGATSGAVKILPIAIGTGTTTIQNSATAAATITLPASTCTLAGYDIANTFSAAQAVTIDDASNNAVTDLFTLTHTTSGSPAAGIGVGIAFAIEDAGGSEEQASFDVSLATVTDGAEDADLIWKANLNGEVQQVLKLDSANQKFVVGQNSSDADGIYQLQIYPVTASRGSLILSAAAHASADRATTITNATDAGAAVTVTLPNATCTLSGIGLAETFTGKKTFDTVDLQMGDSDAIQFGDGAGGDVAVEWNATYLQATSLTNPMWTAAPSVLDPNCAAVAYTLFDDFFSYDQTATVGGWTLFEVGTGTDALSDVDPGGVLLLTCQATTDDACEQVNKTGAAFKLAAGKTLWFEARVRFVGVATTAEVSLGLVNAGEDLTAVADVIPQDGVSFTMQNGAAAMALTCSKDGTNTGAVAAVHTLVNNTWTRFGLLIDGVTSVTPYIDGVAGTAATATICDDELLTPYFLVRNGDATTQEVLQIDYVKVVQLR
jgi:hypothetical protein